MNEDEEKETRDAIIQIASEFIQSNDLYWNSINIGDLGDKESVAKTIFCLSRYASDRSKGILNLLSNGFDWDAEIILRTIYESSAKILLISLSEKEEQERLIEEFWEIIPIVSDRRRARKAKISECTFPPGHQSRDVYRLLYDERMMHTTKEMSKRERQDLERKWSFSEILNKLQTISRRRGKGGDFRTFLHIYGMESHLAHADHAAMDLMFDRALRPKDELRILRSAHISRITSDIISLGLFTSNEAHHVVGGDASHVADMKECFSQHMALCDRVHDLFSKSQMDFYREMNAGV